MPFRIYYVSRVSKPNLNWLKKIQEIIGSRTEKSRGRSGFKHKSEVQLALSGSIYLHFPQICSLWWLCPHANLSHQYPFQTSHPLTTVSKERESLFQSSLKEKLCSHLSNQSAKVYSNHTCLHQRHFLKTITKVREYFTPIDLDVGYMLNPPRSHKQRVTSYIINS